VGRAYFVYWLRGFSNLRPISTQQETFQQRLCDSICPVLPCWLSHHLTAYDPADVRVRGAEKRACYWRHPASKRAGTSTALSQVPVCCLDNVLDDMYEPSISLSITSDKCIVWSVKLSLLLFFWRLFDSLRTRMRIFWYMMLFVTASTYVITIFIQLFACGAPADFFKFGAEGCSSKRDIYLANLVFLFSAGTDIGVDALLLLIPFPLLWKLQVNQRQKCILATIFLLPLLPIAFGILRLVFCNPTSGTVNVIKFMFYHMLENTAGTVLLFA
jgi:hypothetical protein